MSASTTMCITIPSYLLISFTDMMQNLDLLEPHNLIPNGVWSFDDIIRYGEEHKQCPYFTARRMVSTR